MNNIAVKDLFEYTHEMNAQFIDLSEKCDVDRANELMDHVLNAMQIWLDRIHSKPMSIKPWHSRKNAEERRQDNTRLCHQFEEVLELNSRQIEYSNTRGQTFDNSLRDILYHVVNHSTHHRSQIGSIARAQGIDVPPSDFIFYKRKKA